MARWFSAHCARARQREKVTFSVDARALSIVNGDGRRVVAPGWFTIAVAVVSRRRPVALTPRPPWG